MHKNYNLIFKRISENFDTWLVQPFISPKLRNELQKAQILIVPILGFREYDKPVFPVGTDSTLSFFRKHLPQDVIIDICIEDHEYTELGLYSKWKDFGIMIVTFAAFPLFVNLMTELIKKTVLEDEEKQPIIQIINEQQNSENKKRSPKTKKSESRGIPAKHFEKTQVKLSIIVTDSSDKSIRIDYEGTADDFHKVGDDIQKIIYK